MPKTVVGLFPSTPQAEQVKNTLVADGYTASEIRVVANDDQDLSVSGVGASSDNGYTDTASGEGTSVGDKIRSFFRNFSGGDEHAHHHYATGLNQGGALLAVTVSDEKAADVASTLREFGARDIEGASQQATGQMSSYDSSERVANTAGETAIPVVEEELVVGKREVDRGGVRIYSHVVERPVEADITLRDEHIHVERRAVNRPVTAADFGSGDSSFELRASGEEAVIGKSSRVTEEVLVGKQASEHTEAVHDTVRKTEVEVEQIPGQLTDTARR